MARPVVTSVSHATRLWGSWAISASSTESEIWSAILSGCPSVTDSEVNRWRAPMNAPVESIGGRSTALSPRRGWKRGGSVSRFESGDLDFARISDVHPAESAPDDDVLSHDRVLEQDVLDRGVL